MNPRDVVALGCLMVGGLFFLAGTIGLLRFPDVYTRLHALTKADTLGLGCVVVGLAIEATGWVVALKLLLIWLLVCFASATSAQLIARRAYRDGVPLWRAGEHG